MAFLASLSLYSRTMLGICVALLVIVAAEVAFIGGANGAALPASAESPAGNITTAALPPALQIPPVAAYREVRERPLFSDTRRPPPQQEAADANAARATQLSSKWKVTGIVVAGDESFAHLEGLRDRKTVRVRLGEPLDGWKLQEVQPDHLVFGLADTTATLQLHTEEEPAKGRQR